MARAEKIPLDAVIGVDGGGSKTAVHLVGLNGALLGQAVGGASNYQSVGLETALGALEKTMNAAFAQAGLAPGPVRAVCLGLAGVDRPEDQALFTEWLPTVMPQTPFRVVNDGELLLAAGTPEGWGIALICGTGSICVGRNRAGRQARADGWGHLLGDDGSGYAIGRAALRAVAAAADGRGPATGLTESVLAHWSLPKPEALIGRVYRQGVNAPEIAALAPLVDRAAQAGDEVAAGILAQAGAGLARTVRAVAEQLGFRDAIPLALAGGVITRSAPVRTAFEESARVREGLMLDPIQPVREPVQGAVRIALDVAQGRGD